MASVKFELDVSYSQLIVFSSALQNPFNDWTQEHVDQGFAWRDGSVSFRTFHESGPHSLSIEVVENFDEISKGAIRVIEVPFDASLDGSIEISGISGSVPLTIPCAKYCLRCEMIEDEASEIPKIKLTFARNEVNHFAVVLADEALSPPVELITSAVPAHS